MTDGADKAGVGLVRGFHAAGQYNRRYPGRGVGIPVHMGSKYRVEIPRMPIVPYPNGLTQRPRLCTANASIPARPKISPISAEAK